MDADILKTLPGNRWKRSGFGVKLWLYNIAIHTQGRPFIFNEYGYVLCYSCNEDYRIYKERFFKG